MPAVRKEILRFLASDICKKMGRKKTYDGDIMETPLNRCLSTFEITLLGLGHMIGGGIYVLLGTVARDMAGPGVILSFLLAGLASFLSALCYAELGARVPKAGSAYAYAYVSVGEFWAFIIGWNIILEHMIGAASVARVWSGYVDSLCGGVISRFTMHMMGYDATDESLGNYPDPLAALLCLIYAALLAIGVKTSTAVNSILTMINLCVMGLVIVLGIYFADTSNWDAAHGGFLPYGFAGVLRGAATCFYAYIGFDSIATSSEEARNPYRSIPLATTLSMIIVTVGYIAVSGVLTLVVPYNEIAPTAALAETFASKGVPWAKYIISIGALCGMTTTLFGSLFSLPRTLYAMASDGLLFGFLANVNEHTQLPMVNLMISGVFSAMIALFFDLQHLLEFMSIGTFLAYTIVSASVIVLRYRPERQSCATGTSNSLGSPSTEGADSTRSSTSNVSCLTPERLELLDLRDSVGKLKQKYNWLLNLLPGIDDKQSTVTRYVTAYVVMCISFVGLAVIPDDDDSDDIVGSGSKFGIWKHYYGMAFFFFGLLICPFVIYAHRQNPRSDKFRVPMVPIIPCLSIILNISLMFHLSSHTWFRFFVWMIVGMLTYFFYGIHWSKETVSQNSYSDIIDNSESGFSSRWQSILRAIHRKEKRPSECDILTPHQ